MWNHLDIELNSCNNLIFWYCKNVIVCNMRFTLLYEILIVKINCYAVYWYGGVLTPPRYYWRINHAFAVTVAQE